MEGVSVIIVCHNGATRLAKTLSHLKAQESAKVPWELLIVDNASTDGSADIARSLWKNGPAPLRVVNESRLGVRYARERGIAEAKYCFLGFVDDDNWVAPDWVRLGYEIISSDSTIGALGSVREPACEVPPQPWFDDFHAIYAILTDQDLQLMQHPPTFLPTAGLIMRRAAWDNLVRDGFCFLLSGTVGKKPQGGEDTELTLALHLSGWKLQIDRRLRLQHFMPAHRLRWTYLRWLERSYAQSHVPLDAYTEHSLSLKPGARRWLSDCWWYQASKSFKKIAHEPAAFIATLVSDGEGRNDVIEVERQLGRALALLRLRGRYRKFRRKIREARWIRQARDEQGGYRKVSPLVSNFE